ncbi:DUF1294 domain-containing protein [Litoreibacter sp.]|nr:DUF1294 domain-containing protein [Litoreibacter sp.]
MLLIIILAYTYLLLVNLGAFGAFAWDKHRARTERKRVPEMALLGIAASGGWFGAKLGQKMCRHKTRKEPFRELLNAIPLLHMIVVSALVLTMGAVAT